MGRSPGQLLSLLPSGLLRRRKEAWSPALLLEGKCRFLGSQSTTSGINLLAIWPGPYFSRGSAAHRGGTKGLPPKSPCGYYPRPPFGLVFYLPSPTKAMPMDLRASTCLLAYWTSIVPLEPTSSLVSPQPEDTKELDT